MIRDGLIPHNCPVQNEVRWLKDLDAAANKKRGAQHGFQQVCKAHLKPKLQIVDEEQLLAPCNRACPLAGGAFFNMSPSAPANSLGAVTDSSVAWPRIALITAAKFKYCASTFYVSNGDIAVKRTEYTSIQDSVILIEEAADVGESMLSNVDEQACTSELPSTGAAATEFFRLLRNVSPLINFYYHAASRIYLTNQNFPLVKMDRWIPFQVVQNDPAGPRKFLIPVNRDKIASVMADFPRYVVHPGGGSNGVPDYYTLELKNKDKKAGQTSEGYGQQIIAPVMMAGSPGSSQAVGASNVVPIDAVLNLLVRALFHRTAKPFVEFFRKRHMTRDQIAGRLEQTMQLHNAAVKELTDLACSQMDYDVHHKSIRSKSAVFAEDFYYMHGVSYVEVHPRSTQALDSEPLSIQLNISNPPPERTFFELLEHNNSIIFSSASLGLPSPLTNAALNWVKRQHLGQLAANSQRKRTVVSMDDRAYPDIFRRKQEAINELNRVRKWHDRKLEVEIFPSEEQYSKGDNEFALGYQALAKKIKEFNAQGIPVIGMVTTTSYEHSKDLVRYLERDREALNIEDLCRVTTDSSRPGLSTLETWIKDGTVERSASGVPRPSEDSMLFDSIERVISKRMGAVLRHDNPRNVLVVSVHKKVLKGANFKGDLTDVVLGKSGYAYLGQDFAINPDHPFCDMNLFAFCVHPRNFVNEKNFRRIAIQAVSIGGTEIERLLTGKLKAADWQGIRNIIKWSHFGAMAVVDYTCQGIGRITRARSSLPVRRCVLMSHVHTRLFLLGMQHCTSKDILITPDIRTVQNRCAEYWAGQWIELEDEHNGSAEWASIVYKSDLRHDADALRTVRDIRAFLATPAHRHIDKKKFAAMVNRAFGSDYGDSNHAKRLRREALDALIRSYVEVSPETMVKARLSKPGRGAPTTLIFHHQIDDRISAVPYRDFLDEKEHSGKTIMVLKPRELYELSFPAADEMAIRTVLASLQEHAICRYEVKSALDTSDFNGAIKNGTHEAGDFLVQMRGFSLLLDAKSTSVHSTYNPSERDQADVGREVLGKCARFHQAYGRFPDAFIFVTSGWDYQDAWLTEDVPGCVPIFHMDACTSMSAQRMNVEFDKTLQEITGVLESMRSQSDNQA